LSYDIPGPKTNGVLSALAGGWSVDGTMSLRSGFPVRVFTRAVNIPGIAGGASTRPDLVSGQPIWLTGTQCASVFQSRGALRPGQSCPGGRGLNPAAFALPSTPRQGTLGPNAITGFGAKQFDLSVRRAFVIVAR